MKFLSHAAIRAVAVLVMAASGCSVLGAQPYLVKDINPGPGYSSPFRAVQNGGTMFFAANDGVNGVELWKTDGTTAGTVMVKDILQGVPSSMSVPSQMAAIGGTLFFSADGGGGTELWKSDGTAAGTVMVKDINPNGAIPPFWSPSDPQNLTEVGGMLVFNAWGGVDSELWGSDGTTAGTIMVKDINPGNASGLDPWSGSGGVEWGRAGGAVFFVATDGVNGKELWRTDGTAAGTFMVKDINPGSGSSFLNFSLEWAEVGGTLFFQADDGTNGNELWKSDGTVAGTVMVKNIYPGGSGPVQSVLKFLTNVGGTLFFAASDGANGYELWKSDGTASGTVMVKDIYPGSGSSFPADLMNVGGTLFFTADDGVNGMELWKSDGTASGTVMVRDINPGSVSSVASGVEFISFGGRVYFAADDGINGRELWMSDGTSAGTAMVTDIRPGGIGSTPYYFVIVGQILFFSADDGVNGRELWAFKGPVAPTITSTPSVTATEGVLYSYTVVVAGNPLPGVAFSGLPSWLTQNGDTVSGTPAASDIGVTGTITATATNAYGSDSENWQITVSATITAPVITSTAPITATEGQLYSYSIAATGNPLPLLSVAGQPAWLSLNGNVLSGTPTNGDVGVTGTITITATNSAGTDIESFQIPVAAAAFTKSDDSDSDGGGGCAAGRDGAVWLLLLVLAALAAGCWRTRDQSMKRTL